ncbi:MAG: hypothetical protein ACREFR_03770 [Limisphaerales bacterium]
MAEFTLPLWPIGAVSLCRNAAGCPGIFVPVQNDFSSLNEPGLKIPIAILKAFDHNAYSEIRRHTGTEVAVVFHDSFRPMAWQNFMNQPQYSNVVIAMQLYQSFDQADARQQFIFALNHKIFDIVSSASDPSANSHKN